MHMLIPIRPHKPGPFFHNEPTASGNDSTKNGSAPPPNGVHGNGDFFSWMPSLLPVAECAEHNSSPESFPPPAPPRRPCPRINAAAEPLSQPAARSPYHPTSALTTSHHVAGPRSRLTTAGFQSRRREGFAWSHFFPRSVGFGPTVSNAKGAFTTAPSMLCHDQAIPSISSYSASPFRHRRENIPFRFHSKKYLWIELALPNSFFGNAFHWQPVRSTKTIPSKTLRGSMGLRPPPGRRRYRRFFLRFRFVMSDLTRSQSSSDTAHDRIALMASIYHGMPFTTITYLRIRSKYTD